MATHTASPWLATTKLVAPARRKDVLLRERLLGAVSDSLSHCPLILISAPAGAGKTTLLSELPHAFPETTWAWLLLDSEDNDPSRFVAALLAALQTAGASMPGYPGDTSAPRDVITGVINAIAACQGQVGVVLDDLHVISDAGVHELLDYFLDHLPPSLRVVVGTRHDPPLSLARRRARGEVGEIRMPDLGFSQQETSLLANQCLGLNLTEEEIGVLHARTEGWAAGLRLLATSLSQAPGVRSTFFRSGMQGSRRIFDFLAEEVLDQQSPELRRFLLETSILSSLRPEVCNALTGRSDSTEILEDLYRRNLYVVAANESESSFRYHDLFADFLRERLRRERPSEWVLLHQRAAQVEPSAHHRVLHLFAAESWDAAAETIAALGPEYVQRGFLTTLQRWITSLPEDVRLSRPRLLYLLGHAIWTLSDFSQAQPYLEKALEGFRRTGDSAGQGEALAALSNSALMNNRFDEARALLNEALQFDLPAASEVQIHSVSVWDAIYREDWPAAREHLGHVHRLLEDGAADSNPLAVMVALFATGIRGGVAALERICAAQRHRLSTESGDLAWASHHLLWGVVLLNRGDYGNSLREAELAGERARAGGHLTLVNVNAALCTSFAMIAGAQGRWADMETWSTGALNEEVYGQIPRNWRLHSLYLKARAQFMAGDVDALRESYQDSLTPNPFEAPVASAYRHLIRGMLRFVERSYAQSEQAFREALEDEEKFKVTRAVSSARVLLAHVLLTRGRVEEALEVFSPFLKEASEVNLPGMLSKDHFLIVPLLRLAYEHRIEPAFCKQILESMGAPLNPVSGGGGEALSDRELEVLRVLSDGLGNREIAARLFVSETTVKTHVQRILRKLDANSRTQAVAKARALMIL